ncbi:ATPase [Micromonospora craterilacus]|uniref:ATPase n=1 Tax=Micromonospora craterilacus TaxID=1655439 RepID=A0A2W2ECA4_9ACTN|nr:AAA family ATPase [Micromonospora craterilacus]PZG14695.1 ATPase [Micromonospora craterilacus]
MKARSGGVMIGRDHPAGLLRAEVDRAAASHGGLVLVTGEPGIGKTTLVTAATDEARRQGALVLGAACWDSASAPGYWPWVQILRGLRRSPDDWAVARESAEPALALLLGEAVGPASPAPGLLTPAGMPGDGALTPGGVRDDGGLPGEGEAAEREAFVLYDAVTTALVAVSQRRPVMVVLDDLHWADAASMRLLRFAAQHTWFERLLFVGTYRDAEVESGDHPLRPLLMSLVAKATTISLTGLSRDEVGALMARTTGREPAADCVDDVHRRTGGNPFFVEQTARLWHTAGSVSGLAPGVREVVRRRLDHLPATVVDTLTVAAVLGREFHGEILAASAGLAPARLDQILDAAVTARLVLAGGDGRYAFVHDLVRETLYDGLADDHRRTRHAAVVRAVDEHASLSQFLIPADLARHAWLAGDRLDAARATDLLVAAARDASCRLALEESAVHFRRALQVVRDDPQRVKIMMELADRLFHTGDRDEAHLLLADTTALALGIDEPALLARFAVTVQRHYQMNPSLGIDTDALVREAYQRFIGEPEPDAPVGTLVTGLIAATETLARQGQDHEALTFSLWARHNATWGLGTATDRAALTGEIRDVARRAGDRETELWSTSLRWVALLELGDPGYLDELTAFVTAGRETEKPRHRMATAIDSGIISAFRGNFAGAEADYAELGDLDAWEHTDQVFLGHHLRWSLRLLQGRFDEAEALIDGLTATDYPHRELLRAITAAERGDHHTAARLTAQLEAAAAGYGGPITPLWQRLRAQSTVADSARCAEVRQALLPYRGQWLVALFGCDVSGPIDHWLAVVDAAEQRWDAAVAGFTAARDSADRMGARPWSLIAGAALADALTNRGRPGDTATAAALRATIEPEARALGMRQVLARLADATPAEHVSSASGSAGPVSSGSASAGLVSSGSGSAGVLASGSAPGKRVAADSAPGARLGDPAPAGRVPEGASPAGRVPGEVSPAGRVPEGASPAGGGPLLAGSAPTGQEPDGSVPARPALAGQGPDGSAPAGHGPAGQVPAGQVPAGQVPAEAVSTGAAPSPAYEFRRDGAVWRLTYDGSTAYLPDAKGLRDLRLLLGRPGVDVPAVELLDPAAGPELVAARRMGGDQVLDDEAKTRYRRHLARLDDEIDRATVRGDGPKATALDAERRVLIDQLRAAAGLAGRTRRLGDEAERARKTVTARIRETLRRLDERHPPLAAHLRDTISTGTACRYLPTTAVPWHL